MKSKLISFYFKTILVFTLLMSSSVIGYAEEVIYTGNDNPFQWTSENPEWMILASRLPDYDNLLKEQEAAFRPDITYYPSNTTYKSKEHLSATRGRNLQESIKDVEGAILFDGVGNGVDSTFGLRGFADTSSAVVLLDGVRINEVDGDVIFYPLLSLDDMEAIQIDRGSSSPIYGSNAFSGVIHLTSGRPSDKPLTLFGGVEWTSFNGVRFYDGLSGTLEDKWTPFGGKFSYYFRGGRNQHDGFRDNGEVRITSFDFKTFYALPENRGRFHVGVKHVDNAISNPGAIPFDFYQENASQTLNSLDGRAMKQTIVQVGVDNTFWDQRLHSSVLASTRYNRVDFATTSVTAGDGAFRPDTDLVTTKSRATDLIWELTYKENVSENLYSESLIGLEFRDASNKSNEEDFFQGSLQPSAAAETDRIAQPSSFGFFWRQAATFFEKVYAHVGMRHDWHRLKVRDFVSPVNSISERWTNSSISTGITAKPTSNLDVYFNFSQGFRVPTISDISPFNGTISNGLKPESSNSYELGARLRWKDLLRFQGNFFLNDLEDEIVFDSTVVSAAAPFGQNINVGKSRRHGIELKLEAHPFEELMLYGTYTWTQAKVREIGAGTSLVDGRTFGQVPEHRFTMGLQAQPLKRFFEKGKNFRVGLHGTFTGKQHPVSFESSGQALLNATGGAGHEIKSYSVWDLILSYEMKNVDFYFKVNNLFDNQYYSRAVSATVFGGAFGSGLLPPQSFAFVVPGAPREYLLGMTWRWDVVK